MGAVGGMDWLWVHIALAIVGIANVIRRQFLDWRASGRTVFDAGGSTFFRCFGLACAGAYVWGACRFQVGPLGWIGMGLGCMLVLPLMFGRTQIRENGIWHMSSLLRWEEVREVRWRSETEIEFVRFNRIASPITVKLSEADRDRVVLFLDEILEDFSAITVTDLRGEGTRVSGLATNN